jgi:hypothetical protein
LACVLPLVPAIVLACVLWLVLPAVLPTRRRLGSALS